MANVQQQRCQNDQEEKKNAGFIARRGQQGLKTETTNHQQGGKYRRNAENVEIFREELSDLKVANHQIIAFGHAAYKILFRNLSNEYDIVRIPHYSHYISKENYKKQIDRILNIRDEETQGPKLPPAS